MVRHVWGGSRCGAGYNLDVAGVANRTVRIAGGGVSGLAVATLLAKRGVDVEVFDRHTGGGGRFAGGWQVLESGTSTGDAIVELAGFGFDGLPDAVPVRSSIFLDGLGGRWQVRSQEPFSYFIRRGGGRGSLDDWLRRQALAAGVRLREGAAAPADIDVVARGPACADGVARELVFRSNLADTVAVLFDPRITPTGYAYLFCLGGHATFGVAQVRHVRRLRQARAFAWQRFRSELGEFSVEDASEHGQFMNFSLPRGLHAADGRWYAGEAAGVQDFLYGLGNRLAVRSAVLVAEGILGSWDEQRFRRTIIQPMRATVALRFAYERLGRRGFAAFCRAAAQRDFRELLIDLQRPRGSTLLLARLVMALWRERRGCRHGPLCCWCRRREA
jgi:flavin-dependent dehydrogenase